MIFPILAFGLGLVAMGRTKPKTLVRKMICLGPRSGLVYTAEELPETGTFIVRAPDGKTIAQFMRASMREPGKTGLLWQTGYGDAQLLEAMRRDFAIEPKLAAAPSPAAPKKEATSG